MLAGEHDHRQLGARGDTSIDRSPLAASVAKYDEVKMSLVGGGGNFGLGFDLQTVFVSLSPLKDLSEIRRNDAYDQGAQSLSDRNKRNCSRGCSSGEIWRHACMHVP